MKKILVSVIFIFLAFSFANAENLKAGIKRNEYSDYLEMVDLSAEQREKVLRIRNEENFVLKPLTLDIESKERGLELLNSLQCKTFDFECKKKLNLDIEQRQMEYNEALRKINQKKNYYKIRYRNILTREQDYKIQKMIAENEHKDKVLMERAERAKKQERIDKLKFWERFKKWQKFYLLVLGVPLVPYLDI